MKGSPKMLLNPFDNSSLNEEIKKYNSFLLIEEK